MYIQKSPYLTSVKDEVQMYLHLQLGENTTVNNRGVYEDFRLMR